MQPGDSDKMNAVFRQLAANLPRDREGKRVAPKERLCPVTEDGLHRRYPWAGEGRSGLSCRACHKTWTWRDRDLIPDRLQSPSPPERSMPL